MKGVSGIKSQRTIFYRHFLPASGLIATITIWAALTSGPTAGIFPSPWAVFQSICNMAFSGELISDVESSLRRIGIGFGLALLGAIALGGMAIKYPPMYASMSAVTAILSSIPPIAWTPISILWFGLGNAPAYFVIFLGAFFPLFVGIYAGITQVPAELIGAAQSLGASPSLVATRIILPSALPNIWVGIRTGLAVAWFNVIAAELIGVHSGLGYKIQLNRTLLQSDNVLGLMAIIGILGFSMSSIAATVGKLLAPWAIENESRPFWISAARLIRRAFATPTKCGIDGPHAKVTINPLPHVQEHGASLDVYHLKKFFPRTDGTPVKVLDDVSFSVPAGQVLAIVGPNGSGKTTLIKIIAGLSTTAGGQVMFGGSVVDSPSPTRAIVFQDLSLFSWMTARENIRFALRASQSSRSNGRVACAEDELLKDADLLRFADAYPFELSGGMKQRLAIARALAVRPGLILLDEPFASLDELVKEQSQESILRLLAGHSATVILVTHDLDEAVFMADQVIVLGEGRLISSRSIPLSRPRPGAIRRDRLFQSLRLQLLDDLRSVTSQHDIISR